MRPAFSLGETAGPPPYASMAEAIFGGIGTFPDGRFLYLDSGGQTHAVSYRETLAEAHRLVVGLRQEGMREGDALLISLADARDMVPALWAAVIAGLVAIPAVQSDSQKGPQSYDIAWFRQVFGRFRVLAKHDNLNTEPDSTALDYRKLVACSVSDEPETGRFDPQQLRLAILTSGTTARPRLVGLSDRAAVARWWPRLPDADHATGFLSWASFGHVMGLGHAMPNLPMKAHLDAARFVAQPLSWLDAIEATGATHATMTNFGMSLILRAVAENPDRHWRLDHVRKIGIGAEAISRKTCDRFLKCLANFGLREDALILGYGLSECGPVVGGGSPFSPNAADDSNFPPELDRPTCGHAVRIVGDSGYLLREGEVGRIEVRGPTMTSGYLGDDEATSSLFTGDNWLRTGDLGLLRNGCLTVVGREKEIVIVNARKHTCQEIETAIRNRAGFPEVYATPLDDESDIDSRGAGAPCAVFVVVDQIDDVAPQDIADAVRAATGEAFRFAPRIVATVSPGDIPRTSLGKVQRLALRALLDDPAIAGRASSLSDRRLASRSKIGNGEIETGIARIWRELLRFDGDIDHDADFFALGGDSLLALRMSFLLEDQFGVPVRIDRFHGRLSIAELSHFLSGDVAPVGKETPTSSSGHGLPDWLRERLHSLLARWPGEPALKDGLVRRVGTARAGMPVFWCMQQPEEALHFEKTVGERFPAYAMRSGQWLLDYNTPVADALVDRYLDEINEICPEGPVVVGGTCQGVNIAIALVRRLVSDGRDVKLLAAAECRFAELCDGKPLPVLVALFPAIRSNFNPYRYFRHPEIGLRKLAPNGLRLEMIDASHTKIMIGPAMKRLAHGLEAAVAWAQTRDRRDDATAPAPSSAAMYQCRVTSPSKRLELRTGEKMSLPVKLKNFSPVAWEPFERSALMIGNHWLSDDGGMRVWSDGRAPLKRRLGPGERAYMTLEIVAPHEAGNFLLEVDMVEEGIRWFTDVPIPPLQIPVRVQPQPEGPPPAARSRHPSFRALFYRWADTIPFLTRAKKRK
ncbi:MAG: AMP-binding protein [Rhizobiaceae bacterium]|nr:AMP-binding protein [Rhizobiaceae bacterium]